MGTPGYKVVTPSRVALRKFEPSWTFHSDALEHLDALHNFALYLTKKPSEADDLVQETYLRAFRFSHRFEPGTHMRAWLFQIARNTFFTVYRIRDREAAVAENGVADWDVPMFYDVPNEDAEATTTHIDLERAMKRLPEEFRTIILLAEVEELRLEEIARVMSCPVGTVKSRIFRTKERLRGLLRDYDESHDGDYSSENGRATSASSLNNGIHHSPRNWVYLINHNDASLDANPMASSGSSRPYEPYQAPQLPSDSELDRTVERFKAEEKSYMPALHINGAKRARYAKPKEYLAVDQNKRLQTVQPGVRNIRAKYHHTLSGQGGTVQMANNTTYPATSTDNGNKAYAEMDGAHDRNYPWSNGSPHLPNNDILDQAAARFAETILHVPKSKDGKKPINKAATISIDNITDASFLEQKGRTKKDDVSSGYRGQESIDEILRAYHSSHGRMTVAAVITKYGVERIKKVWIAHNLQIRKRGRPSGFELALQT